MSLIMQLIRPLINGTTVAGGRGQGDHSSQLYNPLYMTIDDDDETIYVSDQYNYRIVAWRKNATRGEVVAGGKGLGMGADQLQYPYGVMIDKQTDSLIIADLRNKRVVRWPRRNGTRGETIFADVNCWSLAMDSLGRIYIADAEKDEVRRWTIGETKGTLIAGGNGRGVGLNQLNMPRYIYIDKNDTLYISDSGNHRVLKLTKDAKNVTVIAGNNGPGCHLTQLKFPMGIVVDDAGVLYVADSANDRVVRWFPCAIQGELFVGGNGKGKQEKKLNQPIDIRFDRHGNFYVLEYRDGRVQMFSSRDLN